ncbi:hypothetical protein NXS19_002312 [Fusarium pseudograminearum]|uniref:DUF6590 domain-containing protein n=1 Tax=Fusarium pseudograminearum (strain CS3096) TaxID=1028729 RepID=K3VY14_FUSPC|nr:hypothetical protein FPSE_09985 [Fusarium pseudograminearum CS3096]EKJ69855.1 hypothetical protein FPSE_09985 [Fusarium pseudograminearum CS3096]KAF0645133.1 hypothetical protein FPSE5266_09985 [Fusarium pseudograminearum]UZP34496.1 hypothetical protein NXS19_002312 [Fusarium pseudograminearum]
MYQTSRSGWSEWSQWIWNTDYQQYYRQRVDVSGNSDIQWQSEYEAVQNNQTPRTPVEQMTQQFGAVNIRSPEQTAGDEQNNDDYTVTSSSSKVKSRSSRSHSSSSKSKSKSSKTSTGKGKAPVQEDIPEDDEQDYDDRHTQRKASIPQEEMYYDEATQQYLAYPQTAQVSTPTPAQPYAEASGEYEDPVLQDALAQSKQYTRDRYGNGESSSATYTAYTQDDEDQPTPAVSAGNQEHIIGTSGESETLDPRYTVAPSHMFQPGEVFKVLWPEPAGGGSIVEETVYRDQYGGRIFVHFRRFIVVANDLGHCTCIPISTYGKKGCKKSGVKAEQHGIVAESSNRNPVPLSNEPRLGFPPVRVHISEPGERISKESRVNYSKLTTVEHNVKVLFIGRVVGSDWDVVTEAVNTSWANKMHTHKKKHRR